MRGETRPPNPVAAKPAGIVKCMAVTANTTETPTRADATAAAEALVAAGAEEVLLFGSVARGEAHERSDIDLVAVFADIDYSRRVDLKRRLEEAATSAVGSRLVQVLVTDRPEWVTRVRKVSASFECHIHSEAVRIAGSDTCSPIRWNKQMVKPMSNPEEALKYFTDRVLTRLAELSHSVTPRVGESSSALSATDRATARLRRMVTLCEDSAVTVELALKALALMHGVPTPTEKDLRSAGHDIGECLGLVPEPHRLAVEAIVGDRGLDLRTMSRWRVIATYPDGIDIERADADRVVEDYVATALAVCGLVIDSIQETVGDSTAMRTAKTEWRLLHDFTAGQDVRTGHPREDAHGAGARPNL